MVCCTVIAAMLALLTRLLVTGRRNPLAWRATASLLKEEAAPRASGRAQSIMHALEGLIFLARNEPNMRIHLGATAAVVAAGIWTGLSVAEWQWLVLAIALVLIAEALNTAVEQACNAVSREFSPAIKAAKDAAAGAVLISAFAALLIGAGVFAAHLTVVQGDASAFYCGGGVK